MDSLNVFDLEGNFNCPTCLEKAKATVIEIPGQEDILICGNCNSHFTEKQLDQIILNKRYAQILDEFSRLYPNGIIEEYKISDFDHLKK